MHATDIEDLAVALEHGDDIGVAAEPPRAPKGSHGPSSM